MHRIEYVWVYTDPVGSYMSPIWSYANLSIDESFFTSTDEEELICSKYFKERRE